MVRVAGSNPAGPMHSKRGTMDFPQYTIREHPLRAALPQFFKLAFLCTLFYVGILINLYLLRISMPSYVTILIWVILGIMILLQVILTYVRTSKKSYLVFSNRIETPKQQPLLFANIASSKIKKGFFDGFFSTGSIIFEPKFAIKNIKSPEEIHAYLSKLINYSRNYGAQKVF